MQSAMLLGGLRHPTRRGRPARGFALGFALAVVALMVVAEVASTGAAAGVPTLAPARSVSPVAESQVSSALLPTTIRHVIIVMEENHDLSWTLSDPAFHFLYIHDAHATQAYALCHPSAPNYIAITSATDHQCGSDAVTYYKAGNLAGDAANHGLSWQGLAESMPTPCDRTDAYPYVAHHNPWVFYRNLKSTCSTFDRSFFTPTGASRLQQQLTNRTLPALTFITPNMLHDAHDGTLAAASAWLGKYVLHPVHTSLIYSATTAVIILFDEAYKKGCNCPEAGGYTAGGVTVSGGPIYLVVKSPVSTGADVITKHVSDFSVVTTVEWLLGLPSLGHHDNSAYPALKGLFT